MTRTIYIQHRVMDIATWPLWCQDTFMTCSDGFWDFLRDMWCDVHSLDYV